MTSTPLALALRSSALTRGRAAAAPRPRSSAAQAELGGDDGEVVLGQRRRARHQRDRARARSLGVGRPLGQLGGAPGDVAAGQRLVAEDVAQPVAERVARLDDVLVGGAAVGAGVAAVLDQRDAGALRAEDVVAARIDRAVQPVVARVVHAASRLLPARP